MIAGVQVHPLRVIPDERGRLVEVLRADDAGFAGFGQAYVTTAYPGAVKAWHRHERQTDTFAVVSGMMKIVLYDDRDGSPTRGEVTELFAGEHGPVRVVIPPGVWHGVKCVGEREAILLNVPDRPYRRDDPDEQRRPADDPSIPYDWRRKDR